MGSILGCTSSMTKVQSGMGRFTLPFTCALIVAMIATAASAQVDSPEVGVPWLYKGLIVWAFFWAFLDAYTIGANDVANAFANAVGAGTLTHRGACLIACVFEFVGVVGLGKDVTDTIRKKMVDVDLFKHDPYVLATGMSMVNVGSGLWVLAATLLGMPVSTTHSVVGAVLGIGISSFGWNGVKWQFKKGFLGVLASWFISPVFSGTLAAIFYMTVKYTVLLLPTKEAQLQRGLALTPVWCFFAGGIVWGFMFIKGIPSLKKAKYELTIPLTFGLALVHMALGAFLAVPWLRRTIVDRENLPWWTMIMTPAVAVGSYGYRTEDEELKAAYGLATRRPRLPPLPPCLWLLPSRPPIPTPTLLLVSWVRPLERVRTPSDLWCPLWLPTPASAPSARRMRPCMRSRTLSTTRSRSSSSSCSCARAACSPCPTVPTTSPTLSARSLLSGASTQAALSIRSRKCRSGCLCMAASRSTSVCLPWATSSCRASATA